jgi:hypothetical protein
VAAGAVAFFGSFRTVENVDRRELYGMTGSVVRVVRSTDASGAVAHLFTVESAAGGTAVLRPCDRPAKAFAAALQHGELLTLTAAASDGVLGATLVVDRWLLAGRMLLVNNPPLSFAQRRDSFRVPVTLPVDLGLVRNGTMRLVSGTTNDVSQGGCSMIVREFLREGEMAAVAIRFEDRTVMSVVQIVGVPPDRRAPIRARFDQMTPFDRSALSANLRRHETARVRPVVMR